MRPKKSFFLFCLFWQTISFAHTLYIEPTEGPTPLVKAIDHAQNEIALSIYQVLSSNEIALQNPILNALARAQARGVTINILFNTFDRDFPKSGKIIFQTEKAWCYKHQIHCYPSSSAFTWTHNKYLLIDKHTLYLMTMNLSQRDFEGVARNFIVADTDKTDVAFVDALFQQDLDNANNQTAYSPSPLPPNIFLSPGQSAERIADEIGRAKTQLDIYAMYFNNSYNGSPSVIYQAIKHAAKRGVRVRILTNDSSQTKRNINRLKKHLRGIRAKYIKPRSPHLFIHAKAFIIDKHILWIGSQNLSYTSLEKNRELGIAFTDPSLVKSIETQFNDDWSTVTNQSHHFSKDS